MLLVNEENKACPGMMRQDTIAKMVIK